jgi:hypothetical protein
MYVCMYAHAHTHRASSKIQDEAELEIDLTGSRESGLQPPPPEPPGVSNDGAACLVRFVKVTNKNSNQQQNHQG